MNGKRWQLCFGLAALTAALGFAPVQAEDSPTRHLALTLAPEAPDAAGNIPTVAVTLRLDGARAEAGEPLLRMPLVMTNVVTSAKALQGLSVRDAAGPVALTVRDDPEAGQTFYRHWIASRPVSGELVVSYLAPITNAPPARGAAPPLDLRTDDGGFGGAGSTFLMLPEAATPRTVSIKWDFRRSGAGTGLSSLGPGDVVVEKPVAPQTLEYAYFMGGRIGLYPVPPPARGFFAGWEGAPPFDAAALMAWANRLYGHYARFFHDPEPHAYAVFLRKNPVNSGGGVALTNSFIGSYDKQKDVSEFKITLAHEMFHTWMHSLDEPNGLQSSWFSEGSAVFYARRLAYRFGQISTAQFLNDLNKTAARYYTDAMIGVPNAEIPSRFWADTRVRVLPYDRGSMYFAVVDSEVRKASSGKRSLDDLLLSMLDRRRRGQPMNRQAWDETVTAALGPEGHTELERMLAGAVMLPPSDAFGPCFRRTTALLRRYQLGFEPKVLTENPRIVRGLIPGSAAEQAGLRNGDEIVLPVPQDAIQADQHATLTLQIRRGGRTFPITYLPRGEQVPAYQWVRVAGVPDSACPL